MDIFNKLLTITCCLSIISTINLIFSDGEIDAKFHLRFQSLKLYKVILFKYNTLSYEKKYSQEILGAESKQILVKCATSGPCVQFFFFFII